MSPQEVLRRITVALDRVGIDYMLTGSFASAHYGSMRSTMDIDLVIAATRGQVEAFLSSLSSDEYYAELQAALEAQSRESMFNIIDLAGGWKIDLIFRKSRAFSQEEFSRRRLLNMDGVPLFVATAEDVVIAKLEWAKLGQSQRQLEDVAAILSLRRHELDYVYLQRWIIPLELSREWDMAKAAAGISEHQ